MRSAEPPQDDYASYEHELRLLLETFRDADVTNIVWLTADVHWGQAIEYPDWGSAHRSEPIRATPPDRCPAPSCPQQRFLRLDERLYGSVRADAGRSTLTVDLRDEAGDSVYQVVIPAR